MLHLADSKEWIMNPSSTTSKQKRLLTSIKPNFFSLENFNSNQFATKLPAANKP